MTPHAAVDFLHGAADLLEQHIRAVRATRDVLDHLHGRSCPECGREQETANLNHHAPGCRLGDALAVLIAAMPEEE